ncbi:MAG: hypothetical protein U0P45_01365 [Acidimicrobiales bacterium]
MLRRRRPPAPAAPAATRRGPTSADLAEAGWVLPVGLAAAASDGPRPTPAWTLVGTLSSGTATAVDPAGLVVGQGWSLDWWVGADDRWHVPAQEAAVRQDLLHDAPVVETRLRVPGGDVVHRAYGIRAARAEGDEWVVAEVENATPVPCAVALVLRPFVADGLGSLGSVTVEPVEGGKGPDVAHLVRVDGAPALVVPRRPSVVHAGDLAGGDVVDAVRSGAPVGDLAAAACPDGMATLALVFPLPHTAVLRAVVPVGAVDGTEAVAYPSVVPDAATVASGWEVQGRDPRLDVPERRAQVALTRARAQVLLAHDGEAVRRDGAVAADLDPGATELLLGALDVLDRPTDVGLVVARWQERLAATDPAEDATFLRAICFHWLLHRDAALLDWMMPEVSAAIERLDRAERKGRLTDPAERGRAAEALGLGSAVLAALDQAPAAAKVAEVAARLQGERPLGDHAASQLAALAPVLAAGRAPAATLDALAEVLATASPTGAWPGPGRRGRGIGHDLAAAAATVLALRALLVAERPDGLALLPTFPPGWYGGAVEVHDAPTGAGRLSYAVRWHGTRPALLWELEPHPDLAEVTLTAPGLDPAWSTTEQRGEALLAEVAPPEGLAPITLVPDHPDIDPDMRRPGEQPFPPAPIDLPEGGTFS